MAQSRLEKIGTIFTRVTGLLRSGAMKPEDKPIWYDVYEAFPPQAEPRFDRPVPNVPLRKIFYEEDIVRAKYQKDLKNPETINLFDTKYKTNCQQFIEIYNDLKDQGPLDEEKIIETAKELLQEKINKSRSQQSQEGNKREDSGLVSSFSEAKSSPTIDVKDIFKD